jgi:hypothetical protein
MVLKGSALVESVYPAGVARDMGDLDILVPDAQIDAAIRVLHGHDFRALGAPGPRASGRCPRHEAKLIDQAGLIPVELHRRLVDDVDHRRFAIGEAWARARPSALGDHLLPATEDLLIHVCLHFVAGRWTRSEGALGQVRDIAWIADRGAVDWERLAALAVRYGVRDRVRLALRVARLLGQLPRCPVLAGADGDLDRTRRFVATRVLVGRARPPVGSWTTDRAGLAEALWWSRVHLGNVPAGDLPDQSAERAAAVIGRTRALTRLAAEVLRDPAMVVQDARAGSWLRTLA